MRVLYILLYSFLFLTSLKADIMTISDLSMLVANKTNKTLIIDSSIQNNFLVYSNRLDKDFSYREIKVICKKLNYKIIETNRVIYISALSDEDISSNKNILDEDRKDKKKYDNKLKREQLFTKIVETNMKYRKVQEIAKLLNYKVIRMGAGRFLVSSKLQYIEDKFFKFEPLENYVLNGHVYEIDMNKIKDENVNLSALVDYVKVGSTVGLSVFGNVGQSFISETPSSKVSLSAVFEFLVTKGFGKTTSNPIFSIIDDEEISFSSGATVPVANSSVQNNRDNTVATNYENVTVGMNINLIPLIMLNGSVNFHLNLNLTSLISYDEDKNLVSTSTKKLTGKYNLKLNEELPLIQFISTNENSSVSKVPVLSEIPLLGGLFTSISESKNTKITVIIFKLEKKNTRIIDNLSSVNKKLILDIEDDDSFDDEIAEGWY